MQYSNMGPKKKNKRKGGPQRQSAASAPTEPSQTMACSNITPQARMPEGFNVDDFLFSKLFKSINVEGKRVINEILRALYRQKREENPSLGTFRQILNEKKCNKRAKRIITRYGKTALEENPLTAEFDVTHGIILLRELSEEYKTLSAHFWQQISSLRELRNLLSHNYPLVPHDFHAYEELNSLLEESVEFVTLENEIRELEESKNSLDSEAEKDKIQDLIDEKKKEKYVVMEIENLRVILKDILENAGHALEDFTDCKSTVNKNLTDISKAKVQQYDQDTYDLDIKRFRDDSMHELITKGREELKNQYKRLKIANPCPWISLDQDEKKKSSINDFSIDKIFTPLKIDGITEIKELLIRIKETRGALVLYGLAGSGKTSLCLYFLHHWTEGTNELEMLKDYNLVIYVELRTVRRNDIVSYLKTQRMKNSTLHINEGDLVQHLDDLKLLFIIDGFDEAKKESKGVVKDIFAMFPDQDILVTTRGEFREELQLMCKKYYINCKSFEIIGFDESRVQIFTKKVFNAVKHSEYYSNRLTSKATNSAAFLHYVMERGSILEKHLELPLTLALMIYMWNEHPEALNKVTTCTSLYYELFNLFQEKIRDRISFPDQNKDLEKLLLFIGKKAWQLLQDEEELLPIDDEQEIGAECIKKNIPEVEVLSAFLIFEPDDDSDENRYDYSFFHRTQMEYLSAFFWAEEAEDKALNDVIGPISSLRGFNQILMFLVGHFTRKKNLNEKLEEVFELIGKADIMVDDFNFWWKLLTESQVDGKHNRGLLYKINREKLNKRWKLTKDTVVAGLQLLIVNPIQVSELVIDIQGKDPYDVKDFHTVMKSLQEKLHGRYGKNNAILTELFFWQHYNMRCERSSNDLLKTLYPWGHLKDFAGSVEEYDEKFTLNFCFKVKNLRVRVDTKKAQLSLCRSLQKINRNVRQLRVILALSPKEYDPTTLACLTKGNFKGDLELTLPDMSDEDKKWIVDVTKVVSGEYGCRKLFLEKSTLTVSTVLYLMEMLHCVVYDIFKIDSTESPIGKEWDELDIQRKRFHKDYEWM